jgi:hypothetical protein
MANEWINNCGICTPIMKNEIMLFAGEWMELLIIMVNEMRQAQKPKYHMLLLICGI